MKSKVLILPIIALIFYSCEKNELNDSIDLTITKSSMQTEPLNLTNFDKGLSRDTVWINDSLMVPIEIHEYIEEENLDFNSCDIDTTLLIPYSLDWIGEIKKSKFNSPTMTVKKNNTNVFGKAIDSRATDLPKITIHTQNGRGQYAATYGTFLVHFTNPAADLIGIRAWNPTYCIKRSYRLEVNAARYPLVYPTNEYDKNYLVTVLPQDSPQCGITDPVIYPNKENPREGVTSVERGYTSEPLVIVGDRQILKMTTYILFVETYYNGGKINKRYPCELDQLRYIYATMIDYNKNKQ